MAKTPAPTTKTPLVDSFGNDLTKLALEGKLDPVVGRSTEIDRCSRILSRRKKNNPLLIGEPGVGKTAIVEGLATRVINRTCSRALFGKRIIALELANLVAGTKYRGEFEQRIEQIISEVQEDGNIILFIDEIHALVGAGAASGSLDAASILKPALARGEIQCIGSTTIDEYRTSIEKDGALNRRFQQIMVNPTTAEQTREILENIKSRYEDHHSVVYTKDALDSCVSLSDRYITDRFLPDKAIDLMDEAGATVHVNGIVVPPKITELEKKLLKVSKDKEAAVTNQKYEDAAKLRDKALDVMDEITLAKDEWEEDLQKEENRLIVEDEDIAALVSVMTGIPVYKMSGLEKEQLSKIEPTLKKSIIGQDKAIHTISRSIKRSRAGLKEKNKPIGTFLFTGPSGVGKSELAKQLAKFLFNTEEALIRIDMPEYSEKFTASRLTGAPPGYVGYDEGGQLTERVRRRPYSVILLDEIEKADPSIYNILLQVLDDGRLTDGQGKTVDFKNTIIIMTSNVGVRKLQDFGTGVGFSTITKKEEKEELAKDIVRKEVSRQFPPEFINRVDEIVTFNSLTKEDMMQIVDIEIDLLKERVKENGYTIEITSKAKEFLVEKGHDDKFGARPLKRIISTHLEDLVAEAYIDNKVKDGDHLIITKKAKDDFLSIRGLV